MWKDNTDYGTGIHNIAFKKLKKGPNSHGSSNGDASPTKLAFLC
jgi:hypothetical protein